MKTYLKLSTSAVALLGAALMMGNPAYAGDHDYHHHDHHPSASSVSIDVDQSSGGDVSGSSSNSAVLNSHFADHVSGNVGINNVAGTGNAQQNASAINASSTTDKTYVKTDVDQSVGGWFFGMQDNTSNSPNLAQITDNALAHASGNIGVNNAAGHGNLQSNTLAIAITGKTASASVDVDQDISGSDRQNGTYKYVKVRDRHHHRHYGNNNFFGHDHDDYKKVATYNPQAIIDGNALQNASGNIAVNNAAGNGNAQSNALSIIQGKTVSASGTARQDVFAWDDSGDWNPVMNLGKIGGNALQNATGNIAVNNAAGDFNAQSGAVIIAAAVSGGSLGNMSAKVSQNIFVPSGGYDNTGNVNTASLTGNALEYASGAISVNNAAGVGNAQSNMLVLGAKQ